MSEARRGRADAAPRSSNPRSAQTRERIIAAATEVFARSGFHGAKVADIAEQAGIAYGLVYHYFHNKEDILAAIFTERWAQYVTYLHEVGDMEIGFREQMRRLVHFWVEVYRREPDLMTVMINEVTRSYEFLEFARHRHGDGRLRGHRADHPQAHATGARWPPASIPSSRATWSSARPRWCSPVT